MCTPTPAVPVATVPPAPALALTGAPLGLELGLAGVCICVGITLRRLARLHRV